jgi:hypothetical protein
LKNSHQNFPTYSLKEVKNKAQGTNIQHPSEIKTLIHKTQKETCFIIAPEHIFSFIHFENFNREKTNNFGMSLRKINRKLMGEEDFE